MENLSFGSLGVVFLAILSFLLMTPGIVLAHCDTMDGPVIKAAQKALDTGEIEPVLIWVQKKDEPELKAAFDRAVSVRKLNPAARELADMYFFETLVRIHRAGEGAPYTGIKPAGTEMEPGVDLADKALETGSPDQMLEHLRHTVLEGARAHYEKTVSLKKHSAESVEAGREYVEAYVTYVHYIEKLFADAMAKSAHHGEGLEKKEEHHH